MSIISAIRAALAGAVRSLSDLGDGVATAAKAAPKTGNAAPGRDPCEPSEEEKQAREKSLQPVLTFTISEDAPIKEEPFKPEPPPPAPPKPLPLPPKKLAPINRAAAAKPAPLRGAMPSRPNAPAPASKPATALGKAAARFDKRDAAAGQKPPQEATRSM